MKQILSVLALVLALALAGPGPLVADPPEGGIRATISGQLDAFRAGDMAGAFGFASDGIRSLFGNSENFGTMVERGYGMVIGPAEVRFGALREEDGTMVQRMLMQDASGVWHALDYYMVVEEDDWRIGGVELIAQDAVGA